MKDKTKTIVLSSALVVIVLTASIIYNILGKKNAPDSLKDPAIVNIGEIEQPNNDETDKNKAPNFKVMDSKGNMVSLSDYIGKPIVLNFWASWCSPCKGEMPEFEKVYKEKKDEVVFMMVDMIGGRETKESGEKHIRENKFTFPVFYDVNGEASYNYSISSIPTTLFIDKNGIIVTGAKGAINETQLKKGIEMITDNNENNLENKTSKYTKISPSEAKTIMDKTNDYILLDVRSKEEFDTGYIKNAVCIPDNEIKTKALTLLTDKNKKILVYCRSGRRSENAAKELIKMGYTDVIDFGGINEWTYEIVK